MSLTVSKWPFLPEQQRSPEQNERWWKECYLTSPADVTLRGIAHSVVVSGPSGSGKSAALKAFERLEAEQLFMLRYPLARWPEQPHAWASNFGHLGQIMACASMSIKEFLTRYPQQLDRLSKINLEFLRWLIEKYSGPRAFRRWADATGSQALLALLEHHFDDLYPTDTDLLDVQGQIEELVTLSRRFGFDGVAVIVDINPAEITAETILDQVKDLFGWLTPLQFEGFAIKAALPDNVIERTQLINRSRGRISFAALRWSSEQCREICNRHLRAASTNKLTALSEIASVELLASLENELAALYGAPLPRAWLRLTSTLLDYYIKNGQKISKKQYRTLLHTYFTNYVPLQFDKDRRGVWRGIEFIPLDDQPFSFLEILLQHSDGRYANEALLKIAINQGNLNTIASRLRKKIEPIPRLPVYLHNTRSQGYWLENVKEAKSRQISNV